MIPSPTAVPPRYVRSSAVVSREMGEETLVVPVRGGVGDLNAIFSFNALGSDLWKLLASEISSQEMTEWVFEHYEVTRARADADVRAFLSDLCDAGLAQRQPGSEELV